ncbi:MAG: hypothetical protein ACXV8W_14065 [Methylobacter sp.]
MFEQGLRVLKAFLDKEADDGDIDLFHLDESGFSSGSCVLYAWQRQGSTRALPANVPERLNVIGLMNCQGTGYFHPVETTVREGQADWLLGRVVLAPLFTRAEPH